ncbi:hypothetical protein [Desulfallas thermosapovorans]|uniref:Uncharacterized protein n=1 Tax=Desulfallas thermosapovorans DSM 6562 TaxID=1121431 RepID=A0A5S4ZNA8_9FIRM|nr:hypothetical protein [Desulfallas thermosapovorans]TYO93352.1 hypothetical protein LX24_02681 [Desulfallas thermosapovorans DSM 6562]
MAFEVYKPRSSKDNVVAFTKHHIRLGVKLADKLKGDRVEVAYDRETQQLRIKAVAEGGLLLNKNKIGARGIFKFFDLEGKRGNFDAEFNPEDKAIYVNLAEKE